MTIPLNLPVNPFTDRQVVLDYDNHPLQIGQTIETNALKLKSACCGLRKLPALLGQPIRVSVLFI